MPLILLQLNCSQDSHAVPAKITQLLVEVQQLWETVADLYDPDIVNERLLMHVTEFFEYVSARMHRYVADSH